MAIRRSLTVLGIGAATVEAALAAAVLLTGGTTRIASYMLACSVATAIGTWVIRKILALPPRDDDDDGGSLTGGDPEPPPWWPEFERDFRDYARERSTLKT